MDDRAKELLFRSWGLEPWEASEEHVDDMGFVAHLDLIERAVLSYPGVNYKSPEARKLLAAQLRSIAAKLTS